MVARDMPGSDPDMSRWDVSKSAKRPSKNECRRAWRLRARHVPLGHVRVTVTGTCPARERCLRRLSRPSPVRSFEVLALERVAVSLLGPASGGALALGARRRRVVGLRVGAALVRLAGLVRLGRLAR